MRIVYRRANLDIPEERAFIASTWRASFRRSPYAGMIAGRRWKEIMEREIGDVLAHPDTRALVAADPTVTDHIADLFGHFVYSTIGGHMPLVFFCYVKREYRGRGFARGLMRAAQILPDSAFHYVCRTYATDKLLEAGKLRRASWRPLLGRDLEGDANDAGE